MSTVWDECCFASAHALPPLLAAATPVFELFGKADHLRHHVNHEPGTHNFERDNREAFYRILASHFSSSGMDIAATEIECQSEIRSAEELHVPLPAGNTDLHALAVRLASELPRGEPAPDAPAAVPAWRERRIETLRRIVAGHRYEVAAEQTAIHEQAGTTARFWKLRIGGEWSVPVVEIVRGEPRETVVLLNDGGKSALADQAAAAIDAGQRVLAMDPFYFGECAIRQRDYLSALLISTVGERPLGVQASQVQAVAEWATQRFRSPVRISTSGPRSGLIGLVAQVLGQEHIPDVTMFNGPSSLKQVIDEDLTFEQRPEWFCFGLLEQFDISDLQQLGKAR